MKLVVAALTAVGMASFTVQRDDAPSLIQALQRLDRYLLEYEPKLSALVADEDFRQEVPPLTTHGTRERAGEEAISEVAGSTARPNQSRRLESEVAFARLPGDRTWLGFRRVRRIDGRDIANTGPALADLLSVGRGDRLAQAQLLVMQSSEHNLGLPRTTNMPNLPLALLEAKYRQRFQIAIEGRGRIDGRRTLELRFTELATPSIVDYGGRNDFLSRMLLSIEPESGAILRAGVHFTAKGIRDEPRIRVEFTDHRQLGLLVPAKMEERFLIQLSATGTGRATYTNFRRFQTSARIVPQ